MNNITKCNEFYNNSQQILQSVCHEMNSHQGQSIMLCQGPVFVSVVTNRVVNIRPSISEGRRSTPRGAALVLVSALAFYCFGNDTCSAFFVGNQANLRTLSAAAEIVFKCAKFSTAFRRNRSLFAIFLKLKANLAKKKPTEVSKSKRLTSR